MVNVLSVIVSTYRPPLNLVNSAIAPELPDVKGPIAEPVQMFDVRLTWIYRYGSERFAGTVWVGHSCRHCSLARSKSPPCRKERDEWATRLATRFAIFPFVTSPYSMCSIEHGDASSLL